MLHTTESVAHAASFDINGDWVDCRAKHDTSYTLYTVATHYIYSLLESVFAKKRLLNTQCIEFDFKQIWKGTVVPLEDDAFHYATHYVCAIAMRDSGGREGGRLSGYSDLGKHLTFWASKSSTLSLQT